MDTSLLHLDAMILSGFRCGHVETGGGCFTVRTAVSLATRAHERYFETRRAARKNADSVVQAVKNRIVVCCEYGDGHRWTSIY